MTHSTNFGPMHKAPSFVCIYNNIKEVVVVCIHMYAVPVHDNWTSFAGLRLTTEVCRSVKGVYVRMCVCALL